MFRRINHNLIFLLLAVAVAVPAVLGLLHLGFPVTDDGGWMVIRFSAFFQTLRSGEFPVRFLMRLNNGYGYPVADFLYPLFMYLSVPIHLLGINFVNTIKTLLMLCIFTSSLFTFLWLRKLFDNFSSLIGAAVYTFFPYHLFDIYQRGSVGEVLSLTILPFILWQIERGSWFWISIGIACLIVAHNTLAVLFMLLIVPYMLLNIFISKERIKTGRFYFVTSLFGIGVSAFFWLPALSDLQYTVFAKTQVSNVSNYFANFYLIGLVTMFTVLLAVVFVLLRKIQIKKHRLTLIMLIISTLSIYLASPLSAFWWKVLPSSFVQFPFRFLSLTIPSVSFLAACLISIFTGKIKIILSLIIIVLISISAITYLFPKNYQNFPDSFYSTNQDTTTVKNEYMPRWVQKLPQAMSGAKVENLTGKETINLLQVTPNKTVFNTFLTTQRTIQVNTIYFPGWYAYVNGKPTDILYNNPMGLIDLSLNKGLNNVQIVFMETPVRLFSDLISIISVGGLLAFVLLRKKIKL
ncbi:MAG TPA: 6-pyruvoyl-tetrahydropterin synthase-related protein [Patescibacteria group bacterium]|nr:6-pyruvoyl-tetrahydropterin synthase-related protein [Patescibacteria group bacterium]